MKCYQSLLLTQNYFNIQQKLILIQLVNCLHIVVELRPRVIATCLLGLLGLGGQVKWNNQLIIGHLGFILGN